MKRIISTACTLSALLAAGTYVDISVGFADVSPPPKIANKLFALKLNEAIEIGFKTNPEYASALHAELASQEALKQAHSLYKPSIDLNGDTGYEQTEDVGTRARNIEGNETLYRYETGLTVTQRVFDGFEAISEIDRGYYEALSAQHSLNQAAQDVALKITNAYLDVIQQRKLLQIAKENINSHLDILKQIRDNVEAGRSTEADEEQAKARLSRAKAQQAQITASLQAAEAAFAQEVGMQPPQLATFAPPKREILATVEAEIETALISSPYLKSFEAESKAADAAIESAESAYYPDVNLQLNARQGQNLGGVTGKDSSASALFVMNWNLYRGGADIARAREISYLAQQTKDQLLDAQRETEQQIRETWANLIAAQEQIAAYKQQIASNKKVVGAYRDQFNLKRRTLLDVLNAQSELFASRQSALNAEFQEQTAIYRLLALKGMLLTALSINFEQDTFAEKQ